MQSYHQHFQRLARYHQWAHQKLYQKLIELPSDFSTTNQGLFFTSPHGTMAHLFFSDVLWFMRLTNNSENSAKYGFTYQSISELWATESGEAWEKLVPSITELHNLQMNMCKEWIAYVGSLQDAELDQEFTYKNTKGIEMKKIRGPILDHVFNHGTHHRGQVTACITQKYGREHSPALDLLYYYDAKS